jgi:hypothetical protein
VIVDDAHVVGVGPFPSEHDSPLIVDADRIEARQVAPKLLQPIRWRDNQILETTCRVKRYELPLGDPREVLEFSYDLIVEESFGSLVPE